MKTRAPVRFPLLAVFLVLLALVGACAEDLSLDIRDLAQVTKFAFGPGAKSGKISEGEKKFHDLYHNKFAVTYLESVFQQGTVEAKMYALVGLRHKAPQVYEQYARANHALLRTQKVHAVLDGVSSKEDATHILKKIDAGDYDAYLKKPANLGQD